MPDYILLMHAPASGDEAGDWEPYLDRLGTEGVLRGGSAIGSGVAVRKDGGAAAISETLSGFVRVTARDLDHALSLVQGNPVFEAGGTIEVRELPVTD
jgi:hypothetical protein